MGGAGAPDPLEFGHPTQVWLATSDDAAALDSGGYWFHEERLAPMSTAPDPVVQDRLVDRLASVTGIALD